MDSADLVFTTVDALQLRMQTELSNVEVLKEAVTERDSTIAQFRELVQSQAQYASARAMCRIPTDYCDRCSDIETLREAHDEQQNEKATMATKSQAVMNLNLKLQSTAVKSQARLITTEIAKLELAQAEEQLQIVQVSCG